MIRPRRGWKATATSIAMTFSTTRPILMDGFVHNAEGYAKSCAILAAVRRLHRYTGQRSMGYYDQGFLNYYYYMASQFALSDRWFSPVSSKSIANRIATFTGGTTKGLVKDPGSDDHLRQLDIPTIFQELEQANVSWKIYYTVTQGVLPAKRTNARAAATRVYPATDFSDFTYSYQYLYENPSRRCHAWLPRRRRASVGDSTNSFCIDPTHIAPLSAVLHRSDQRHLAELRFHRSRLR